MSFIIKIVLTILTSLFFFQLITINIKVALALGFIFMMIMFAWGIAPYIIDEKKFILIVLAIYPVLPSFWGVDLGGGVPVFDAHRLAILSVIFVLIRKKLLYHYYFSFFRSNIYSFPLLCVIISFYITGIFSVRKVSSLFFATSFVVESVILAVVVFMTCKEKKDIEKLIKYMCYAALILACLGIFERITHYNIYSIFGAYRKIFLKMLTHQMRGGEIRIIGSFSHSIAFGAYFALIIPLLLYRYRNNIFLMFCSTGVVFLAILATQSRGAMVGALIIFVLYFIFINRSKSGLALVLIFPVMLYFYEEVAIYFMQLNPLTATSDELVASSAARAEQFHFIINVIKKNPVIGVGQVPPPPLILFHGLEMTSIDNFYLYYTYIFGLFGLLTYVYFMIKVLSVPIRIYKTTIFKEWILPYLLFAIFSFYVMNTIVALWSFHFIFWIYLGIICRILLNKKNELARSTVS